MNNAAIPLEDTWIDVLHKAKRGLELSEADIALRSGLTREEVLSLFGGTLIAPHLQTVALSLGLDPERLISLATGEYHPGTLNLPSGMSMFTSSWGDMLVHSYLAWDTETRDAVAFDTGADASGMIDFIKDHDLALRLILLTHGHGDHLFDLDRLVEQTGATAWIGAQEDVPGIPSFSAGKEFHLGRLLIETRSTRGHAPGGITYVLKGLDLTVAVVGDALFAGSMGGPKVSYTDCLDTNRAEILSLPPVTILCPGHGPLTKVALEGIHNPFFPVIIPKKEELDHILQLEEAPHPTKESR